jgi:hypothetical protein
MVALLALAIVLGWPPVDPGSASPYNNGVQLAAHGHHAHTEQNGHHRILHVNLDADCDSSAIGCCGMTHCYPGISVDPHDLPLLAGDDGTTAASAVRGTGSDPGMVLPPPRRLPRSL